MNGSSNFRIGFLNYIIQLTNTNDIFFIVKQVSIRKYADQIVIGDQTIRCNNIMFGNITKPVIYHMIRTSNVVEKLAFQCENPQSNPINHSYVFFRYPNFRTNT